MNDTEWKIVGDAVKKFDRKVGIEAECLLLNAKDEAIVPPQYWDRDGFPILAEVRGDPGENAAETYSNFMKKKMEIEELPRQGNRIVFTNIHPVRLKMYKEAMKQVTEAKGETIGKTKNIYGINVEDYSDQIIKSGKIQGVNASCGLHIHFSLTETAEQKIEEPQYEHIDLPLETVPMATAFQDGEIKGLAPVMKHLMKTSLSLYKFKGWSEKKRIFASVSHLNRPTIEWMVKELDEHLFKKFAPPKDQRTKYRQAGFYELKEHGFEYRSLPANDETIAALPEIIAFSFDLLKRVNSFD
jgi:hypothetical protein